jgi:hypothetical protein
MINLEKLTLYLSIGRKNSDYVNGVQLRDDILHYMPRLRKCNFSIDTVIAKTTKSDLRLSSHEDIQRSFLQGQLGSIGSHVDVFAKGNGWQVHACSMPHEFYSRCYIYSLPYQFSSFAIVSNSFQSGTFDKVQRLVVADCRPFEHEYFRIISRSFPGLINLRIHNDMPQEDAQQSRTMITFDRLRHLNLQHAHVDYATQFLTDQYCQVPHLDELSIRCGSLMSVTNDFTSDATRLTCSQVKRLRTRELFVPPARFHEYFLSL